jgi:hypothetical protein
MNNLFTNPDDPNALEHIEERLSSGRTTCCQWYDIFLSSVLFLSLLNFLNELLFVLRCSRDGCLNIFY